MIHTKMHTTCKWDGRNLALLPHLRILNRETRDAMLSCKKKLYQPDCNKVEGSDMSYRISAELTIDDQVQYICQCRREGNDTNGETFYK